MLPDFATALCLNQLRVWHGHRLSTVYLFSRYAKKLQQELAMNDSQSLFYVSWCNFLTPFIVHVPEITRRCCEIWGEIC